MPAISRAWSSERSDDVLGRRRLGDRARGLVDRPGRVAVLAEQEPAHLLVDLDPAARAEHVLDRLGREDAPDRRGRRRRAAVVADAAHLLEHLVEAIGRADRGEPPLDGGDEPGGHGRERGAQRDLGRDRRRDRGGVADLGLDPACDLPADLAVEPGLEAESAQRLREQLGRRALGQHRDGVGGGGDRVGTGAGRLDRHGEGRAAGPLRVQADRDPGGLAHAPDQLARGGRIERAGGVVQQHAVDAELGEPARALDEPASARSIRVDEPGVHARPGLAHGGDRADEVVDVVQRVVQPEDVDARLGRAQDEAADEIGVGRSWADQEGAAQRHHERRPRARLERADALPGALDGAVDGAREAAAAGDLERGVAGAVEVLGEAQDARGRDPADERLLREQPDGGVNEAGHVRAQARDT